MTDHKDTFLPFTRPDISDDEINEIVDSLKSGWLTTGPKVKQFEDGLSQYVKNAHISCVSSATAGLHLALLGLNLKPGDEVITTAFTFVATYNTIVQAGGIPVPVDVEPRTYNIDVAKIEGAITQNTKAIVPVHFAGAPVDLDPLYKLAKVHNLAVIEDAAHAIGTAYKGKKIGSFGDTQVFSFHPNKNMTTGEGGAIATSRTDLHAYVNCARFHGINREAWNRFSKTGSQLYDVVMPGFKYNMMDLQAALGIHQLKRLDQFTEARQKRVEIYQQALKDVSALKLPQAPSYHHHHAWDLYAPTLHHPTISRDDLIQKMKDRNIGLGLHWQSPHLFCFYQNQYGYKPGMAPVAEDIANRVVSLPLFPQMTDDQQNRVIDNLKDLLK